MSRVHFKATGVDRSTPQDFFDRLNAEFGFQLDVCASDANAKCAEYFTEATNGLYRSWDNKVCWMNPPYGRDISAWLAKATDAAFWGATVVCLLPARTDTGWWFAYVWDRFKNKPLEGVEVRFVEGRLKFNGSKKDAPFPSVVVIFRPADATREEQTNE